MARARLIGVDILSFCDHSAWLSELVGIKDYIKFVIQELSAIVIK